MTVLLSFKFIIITMQEILLKRFRKRSNGKSVSCTIRTNIVIKGLLLLRSPI
jgi:hypothetical protein